MVTPERNVAVWGILEGLRALLVTDDVRFLSLITGMSALLPIATEIKVEVLYCTS